MKRSIKSLVRCFQDQRLNDDEIRELDVLLRSDAQAREVFLCETNLIAAVEDIACDEAADALSVSRVDQLPQVTDGPAGTKAWRVATAAGWVVATAAAILLLISVSSTPDPERRAIAKIVGRSGSLIWTGDRGEIVRDISIGTALAGGTIEGMAPDSWFELQFNDSSTVMISGTSMLTFADVGQKKLRLREGVFSANVVSQPEGNPMLIHTPSAVLEVLGTRFDVEARMDSTMLNVSEGEVRVRRLSDGREVDVPAKHRVIAEGDGDLAPQRLPESVNHWKSQLHLRRGCYGKWLPATQQRAAAQKAIPLMPPGNPSTALYLLGIPVSRSDGPPVIVRPDSYFVVRGRLHKPAKVHFGIAVSDVNGEFAGKFRGDLDGQQPISEPNEDGQFEVVYRISDFTLDPCVRDRKEELAVRPDDLVLNGVWAFTHTGTPSGLEVSEVELIPPER